MLPTQHILVHFFQQNGLHAAGVIEEALDCFEVKEVGRHGFHLNEGQVSNEYGVVESGFLRAFTHSPEGDEVTTAFFPPGSVVLEVASFFHRTPSQESVEALADSRLWVISFQKLNALFHAHAAFREFGRSVLVKGFAALKLRMLSMVNQTADERYRALLQSAPDIFQQAPLKHIASYLGVTDTSLSRIRREMTRRAE